MNWALKGRWNFSRSRWKRELLRGGKHMNISMETAKHRAYLGTGYDSLWVAKRYVQWHSGR